MIATHAHLKGAASTSCGASSGTISDDDTDGEGEMLSPAIFVSVWDGVGVYVIVGVSSADIVLSDTDEFGDAGVLSVVAVSPDAAEGVVIGISLVTDGCADDGVAVSDEAGVSGCSVGVGEDVCSGSWAGNR
jgi:hypothetical protein